VTTGSPLLLDTHVWIWAVEGVGGKLGPGVLEAIEAGSREGRLQLHPLSIWEVGTLVRKGRLTLAVPVEGWVEAALALPGVALLPLTQAVALEAARLPDTFPGDPVDRMLVAAATLSGSVLVTRDRRILSQAGEGRLRVLEA